MTIKVQKINSNYYNYRKLPDKPDEKTETVVKSIQPVQTDGQDSVSFKGKVGGNIKNRAKYIFRKLSNYMKEPNEMTNAAVAAIGTGCIAPAAIMLSPGKKTDNPEERKKERSKKAFQAARQPVSAGLAFGFQVPTTLGIAKGLNILAYEKHKPFFNDEVLGTLIPDKKYLRKEAKKVLNNTASEKVRASWKPELKIIDSNAGILQNEFTEKLKKDYTEVGMEVSDAKITQSAKNAKAKNKFLAEKMADAKYDRLLSEKVEELYGKKKFEIKDLDLVTEDYQKKAKIEYKAEFEKLRTDANLSSFDKFLDSIGFKNKKLRQLENAEKELAKNKGLVLLKENMPDAFNDSKSRLKLFVKNRSVKAEKLYANKIFWLSLVTNLFMVGISCVALNWIHPKFANMLDNIKQKKEARNEHKKVEVRA